MDATRALARPTEVDLWVAGPPDLALEMLHEHFRQRWPGGTFSPTEFSVVFGVPGYRFMQARVLGRFVVSADGVRVVGVAEVAPATRLASLGAAALVMVVSLAQAAQTRQGLPLVGGALGVLGLVAVEAVIRPGLLRKATDEVAWTVSAVIDSVAVVRGSA